MDLRLTEALSILRELLYSTEQRALCFYFANYVMLPRDPLTSRGYLELLLPLYSGVRRDSQLSHATSAVALCLLEAWSGKGPETKLSRSFFQKAPVSTRAALEDPEESKKDETLLAVLLLELFEVSDIDLIIDVFGWSHYLVFPVFFLLVLCVRLRQKSISRFSSPSPVPSQNDGNFRPNFHWSLIALGDIGTYG